MFYGSKISSTPVLPQVGTHGDDDLIYEKLKSYIFFEHLCAFKSAMSLISTVGTITTDAQR